MLTFFFASVSVSVPLDLELMGERVPFASILSSRSKRRGDDAILKGTGPGFEPSSITAAGFMGLKSKSEKMVKMLFFVREVG